MPKYLSLEESIRLLIESEGSPRDYCILTLFLNCALRLSELVNLSVSQMQNEYINIVGKGNKQRQIFLNSASKRAVSAWLEIRESMNPQTDALFITKNGTKVTSRGVQDIVKKYLRKAGLGDRGLSTHKLRHTSATTMFKYGHVDVRTLQQLLGHESLNTTQIYINVDSDQLQTAVTCSECEQRSHAAHANQSNPLAGMFGR